MQSGSQGNPAQQDIGHLFLAHRTVKLHNAVLSGLTRRLTPFGLTPVQMAIIYHCNAGDANTVTGLSQLVPIALAGMSRQVEQLVQKGLLDRQYSRQDRRTIHLLLTEEAEAMIPDIIQCCRENESVLLQGVSDEEKRAFINVVDKILDNFNNQENPPPPPDPGPEFDLTDVRGPGRLDAPVPLR